MIPGSFEARSFEERRALLHREARQIFAHALQAADIPRAFDRHLRFEGRTLVRQSGANPVAFPLDSYRKIYPIALGKAALPMLDSLFDRLPGGLPVEGLCCAPSLPRDRRPGVQYYAGGHPLPNQDSLRSAQAALRLLRQAGKQALVFFLISGGGSALFEAPLDRRISLGDTAKFHQALVGSGAKIGEINTVRKHFSAVKGGRLAMAAPDAAKFSLLVSDVPAGRLDTLASGPTLPDPSTVEECREVLTRYRLLEQFPASVRAFFTDPHLPETPGDKQIQPASGSSQPPGFAHSELELLLSNSDLVSAAAEHATKLGFEVVADNTCDDWDYRDAAQYLLTRFRSLQREYPRLCLISGGEVTVRLETKHESVHGTGGRNQHFALACAIELAGRLSDSDLGSDSAVPNSYSDSPIVVLSAGSDGVDGNSPAAGAIADPTTVARARSRGFEAAGALNGFDSYPFFTALGNSVVTGPTNNNLRDLRIFLSC